MANLQHYWCSIPSLYDGVAPATIDAIELAVKHAICGNFTRAEQLFNSLLQQDKSSVVVLEYANVLELYGHERKRADVLRQHVVLHAGSNPEVRLSVLDLLQITRAHAEVKGYGSLRAGLEIALPVAQGLALLLVDQYNDLEVAALFQCHHILYVARRESCWLSQSPVWTAILPHLPSLLQLQRSLQNQGRTVEAFRLVDGFEYSTNDLTDVDYRNPFVSALAHLHDVQAPHGPQLQYEIARVLYKYVDLDNNGLLPAQQTMLLAQALDFYQQAAGSIGPEVSTDRMLLAQLIIDGCRATVRERPGQPQPDSALVHLNRNRTLKRRAASLRHCRLQRHHAQQVAFYSRWLPNGSQSEGQTKDQIYQEEIYELLAMDWAEGGSADRLWYSL